MKNSQSGNVIFYILIAVGLLAALSYVVAHSGRGNVSAISSERAGIYASGIIEYGSILSNAVSQLRLRGYTDTEISFENDVVDDYVNPNCLDDRCQIFKLSGGGVNWQTPSPDINGSTDWLFTVNRIADVGTDIGGTAISDLELVAILPNIDRAICKAINDKLHATSIIPQENNSVSLTKFTGTYIAGTMDVSGNEINGKSAYCFEGNATPAAGTYHYYQVLIAR